MRLRLLVLTVVLPFLLVGVVGCGDSTPEHKPTITGGKNPIKEGEHGPADKVKPN